MKPFLLFLSIFFCLSLFAQTEIWGVKQVEGAKGGGYLFSIDSASNELMIQHRFTIDGKILSSTTVPHLHQSSGSWILGLQGFLMKYQPINKQLIHRKINTEVYGNFIEIGDSVCYILADGGLLKFDPNTLESQFIEGFNPIYINPDNGLTLWDDQYLVWSQANETYHGYICKMNLLTEEVEVVFDMVSNEEATYFPSGKLVPYNGRHYSITYQRRDGIKYLLIYSYHFQTNQYREEYRLECKKVNRSNLIGLVLGSDGKMYSAAKINPEDNNFYLFSFNPANKTFRDLGVFPEEFGMEPVGPFLISDEDIIYGNCAKGGKYDKGSLFKYQISTAHLDSVFCFQDNRLEERRRTIGLTQDDKLLGLDFYFDTDSRKLLYEYDELENKYTNLVEFPFLSSHGLGNRPMDIVQKEDGKIIGITDAGGVQQVFPNGVFSSSIIYQFDPSDKSFEKLYDFGFENIGGNITGIYQLSDGKIFGLIRSNSYVSNSGKYLFDINTQQMERLNDFPWQRFSGNLVMESDSLMITYIGDKSDAPPYSLVRYHIFKDELQVLHQFPSNVLISNLLDYDEDHIVFNYIIQKKDIDSAYIKKMNKNSLLMETLVDLTQFQEMGNKVTFDFSITRDQSLIGELHEEYQSNEKDNSMTLKVRQGLLNIATQNFIEIDEYDTEVADFPVYRFNYIENYSNNGKYYAISEYIPFYDYGVYGLYKELDFGNHDVQATSLEAYSYSVGQLTQSYCGLKKFRKTDFSIHWKGEESSDWYNPNNWVGSQVPDTNDVVCIDAFTPNLLCIDTFVQCDKMIISYEAMMSIDEKGSLLTSKVINHGSMNMFATGQSKASFIDWDAMEGNGSCSFQYSSDTSVDLILASPMQTDGFQFSNFFEILNYTQEEFQWTPIYTYPYFPQIDQVYQYKSGYNHISFKGVYFNEEASIEIPELTNQMFYPIPNPYPASISTTQLDLSNLNHQAIYRFDSYDSSFMPYIDGLGDGSPLVQPLEHFWIYSNGNEVIPIKPENRLHAIHYQEEESQENHLQLMLSGKGKTDLTWIRFNEAASSDFDASYDALKYSMNEVDSLRIFTKTEDHLLAINQLPDTTMMDLFMEANEEGSYTISIEKKKDFDFVVLEDLIWNTRINLLEQDYSFDYFISDEHYPFKLYFNDWGMQPVEAADIQIYYYPESIVVKSRKQIDEADIIFYDLAGRIALKLKARDFHHFEQEVNLPTGHYIVQLRSGEVLVNKKVLVRH